LVLEKNVFSQIHYNLRLVIAIRKMQRLAEKHGVRFCLYDPRVIRKAVCSDGNATKKRVSEILITYFPELIVYRKSDKAWVIRYYQNMFDAVAVGLTFIKGHTDGGPSTRRLLGKRQI
jgi:Holliday junction resolvasome RuvABC endonuclease subunit